MQVELNDFERRITVTALAEYRRALLGQLPPEASEASDVVGHVTALKIVEEVAETLREKFNSLESTSVNREAGNYPRGTAQANQNSFLP